MPDSTNTTTVVPGLTAGTWVIDPIHSEVSFSVRHLMVSKVRGTFTPPKAGCTEYLNAL